MVLIDALISALDIVPIAGPIALLSVRYAVLPTGIRSYGAILLGLGVYHY